MIMAMFENCNAQNGAPQALEPYYGEILKVLMDELKYEINEKAKKHRELVSMVIQAVCMAFYQNAVLTFQTL
jgi:hypothetical protein